VERKVFLPYAWQGQQTLTAFGANFLNYAILGFSTIIRASPPLWRQRPRQQLYGTVVFRKISSDPLPSPTAPLPSKTLSESIFSFWHF
jgi:hypothetical protein